MPTQAPTSLPQPAGATAIESARMLIGWSRDSVARAAGRSPRWMRAVLAGQILLSRDEANEVINAIGYQVNELWQVRGLGDVSIVTAAANVFNPDAVPLTDSPWIESWIRAGFVSARTRKATRVYPIGVQAGSSAKLIYREGLAAVRARVPLPYVVDYLREQGIDYALTSLAAVRKEPLSGQNGMIYVADPDRVSAQLSDWFEFTNICPGRVALLPMASLPVGARDIENPNVVTEWRAIVEAFSGADNPVADGWLSIAERALGIKKSSIPLKDFGYSANIKARFWREFKKNPFSAVLMMMRE